MQDLTDTLAIETSQHFARKASILFEADTSTQSISSKNEGSQEEDDTLRWDLIFESEEQKKQAITILCKLWRDLFKLELMMINKTT